MCTTFVGSGDKLVHGMANRVGGVGRVCVVGKEIRRKRSSPQFNGDIVINFNAWLKAPQKASIEKRDVEWKA